MGISESVASWSEVQVALVSEGRAVLWRTMFLICKV